MTDAPRPDASRRRIAIGMAAVGIPAALAILFALSRLGASNAPTAPASEPVSDDGLPSGEAEGVQAVVQKSKRRMFLFAAHGTRCFRIALGSEPVGDKQRVGDGRTPVGTFTVCEKNEDSRYFLFIGLNYPDADHASRGLSEGLISQKQHDAIVDALAAHKAPPWYTRLGGEIGFHGGGASWDWTRGCIALENGDMRELYAALRVGMTVRIEP